MHGDGLGQERQTRQTEGTRRKESGEGGVGKRQCLQKGSGEKGEEEGACLRLLSVVVMRMSQPQATWQERVCLVHTSRTQSIIEGRQ